MKIAACAKVMHQLEENHGAAHAFLNKIIEQDSRLAKGAFDSLAQHVAERQIDYAPHLDVVMALARHLADNARALQADEAMPLLSPHNQKRFGKRSSKRGIRQLLEYRLCTEGLEKMAGAIESARNTISELETIQGHDGSEDELAGKLKKHGITRIALEKSGGKTRVKQWLEPGRTREFLLEDELENSRRALEKHSSRLLLALRHFLSPGYTGQPLAWAHEYVGQSGFIGPKDTPAHAHRRGGQAKFGYDTPER